MKTIGESGFEFPETLDEVQEWKPVVIWSALSVRVLAVARTRVEGAWCAYIDAVPGQNHDNEQAPVLLHGAKMSERVARAIFGAMEGIPYAH